MPDFIIDAIVAVTIGNYAIIAWLFAGIVYRRLTRRS
jgi:hypothetical protein